MMELFRLHLLRVFAACVIFAHFNSLVAAAPVISTEDQALAYLQKYGYLNESNLESTISSETVQTALKKFQKFVDLPQTGLLNSKTLQLMNMPRCGVKDIVGSNGSAQNKRYSIQGTKWRKTNLTYRISKYPCRYQNTQKVDKEIAKAFKAWSDATNLNFMRMDKGHVVIDIRFEAGEHCDQESSDGPGGVYGHAFPPQYGGDVHFDDLEKWTIDENHGTNLLQIAAHEFGHALGLSHSNVKTSVMFPIYWGYEPTFSLQEEDIMAIQYLYGSARKEGTDPVPAIPIFTPIITPDYTDVLPDLCLDASIDAATTTQDGKTYVFKGDYYWEVNLTGLVHRDPRAISQDWGGLPGNLDAALTWSNGDSYFFKRNEFWKTRNKQMQSGYPKSIAVYWGLPDDLDAAFFWVNGKSYFLKGSQYWRYDNDSVPHISDIYPRPIRELVRVPNDIDAVLPRLLHNRVFFFKRNTYYRSTNLNTIIDESDPPYPRPAASWWFGC